MPATETQNAPTTKGTNAPPADLSAFVAAFLDDAAPKAAKALCKELAVDSAGATEGQSLMQLYATYKTIVEAVKESIESESLSKSDDESESDSDSDKADATSAADSSDSSDSSNFEDDKDDNDDNDDNGHDDHDRNRLDNHNHNDTEGVDQGGGRRKCAADWEQDDDDDDIDRQPSQRRKLTSRSRQVSSSASPKPSTTIDALFGDLDSKNEGRLLNDKDDK